METNEASTNHGSDMAFIKLEAVTALKMAGKNTKMMKVARLAKAKPSKYINNYCTRHYSKIEDFDRHDFC